jgi:hypothetical protein
LFMCQLIVTTPPRRCGALQFLGGMKMMETPWT